MGTPPLFFLSRIKLHSFLCLLCHSYVCHTQTIHLAVWTKLNVDSTLLHDTTVHRRLSLARYSAVPTGPSAVAGTCTQSASTLHFCCLSTPCIVHVLTQITNILLRQYRAINRTVRVSCLHILRFLPSPSPALPCQQISLNQKRQYI